MIRYKVVKVVGFERFSCYAQGRFCREYKKGAIIAAVGNTNGIYVFDNEKNADRFIIKHSEFDFVRIKVRIIGKSKKAKYVCGDQNERSLTDFWYTAHFFPHTLQDRAVMPPRGTLVCEAVEVME